MENNIPTAEEFLKGKPFSIESIYSNMIEFAKLHVESALKSASEQPSRKEVCKNPYQCTKCQNDTCDYPTKYIEQSLILNAYSLTLIK
jgi:hypothetical protein